jgi:hypothetical protein
LYLGELLLDFVALHAFPPPVRDLADSVNGCDLDILRRDNEAGGLHRALHRAGECDADFLAREAGAEFAGLLAAGVGEEDVDGAGESVFGGELSGAVTDEVDARVVTRTFCLKGKEKGSRSLVREPVLGPLTSTRVEPTLPQDPCFRCTTAR